MEIREEVNDNHTTVTIAGRLDASTSGDLENKIVEIIDNGAKKVIIDFNDLDYISSSGLRVLLISAKKCNAGSIYLALCNMKSHIKEVFDIAGFTPIFNIFEDLPEAEKAG